MSNKLLGAEIFSTGTHNKMEFKDSDLEAIVKAFDALGASARVPLKFGHNNDQTITDGQPALGWVQRVWKDGNKLLADFVDMPTVVFDVIKKGLYKFVSVELLQNYNRNGASFPWVLDAVALLGADIPAVSGLKDLQALALTRKLAGSSFKSVATFTLEHHQSQRISTMTPEEETKLRSDLAASQAAVAKLTADAEADRKARFTEKVEAHRATVRAMFETAITEGRIAPRVRDRELGSRLFKSDDEVLTAYTVDGVKAIITENQLATFTEKKGPTSKTGTTEQKMDFTNKRNDEVLLFKVQEECIRVGGKVNCHDDMLAAQTRVLRAEPELARAYFSSPDATFKSADAA